MSVYTKDSNGQLWRIDVATDGTLISTSVSSGGITVDGSITVGGFIQSVLRLLRQVDSGNDPTDQEIADGMRVLNDLLDSWNTERNAIYTIQPHTLDLEAGTQTYTVGAGGDLGITWPARITEVLLRDSSGASPVDTPVRIVDRQEWQRITMKSLGNSSPSIIYDDGNYPLRSLSFYPIPAGDLKAIIYSWYPLVQVTSSDDTIALPPGYSRALRYNFAVDWAPEYGITLSDVIVAVARDSKMKMKALNSQQVRILPDPGIAGGICDALSSLDAMNRG